MAESAAHIRLVDQLQYWISELLLDGDSGCMLVDSPDNTVSSRPPKIRGFVPDAYVSCGPGDVLVIGEAKTARDLVRKHSLDQIAAFLQTCSESENSYFILAVPWDQARLAQSLVKKLKVDTGTRGVRSEVLEKLGG